MRQLSKELCIKAAPCIRPIRERDRHTHTPLSFSASASLPTTKQNSEHFYFKSNYFTLNCNQMIASSNRKCVFLSGCACVWICAGCVWVCELLRSANDAVKIADKMKVNWYFSLRPLDVILFFFLFCFCFFLLSQAEQRSRHTRTPAKDICVANEIFNIATR